MPEKRYMRIDEGDYVRVVPIEIVELEEKTEDKQENKAKDRKKSRYSLPALIMHIDLIILVLSVVGILACFGMMLFLPEKWIDTVIAIMADCGRIAVISFVISLILPIISEDARRLKDELFNSEQGD